MGKNVYLIVFIFIIVIALPVILIKGLFFYPQGDQEETIIIKVYKHKQNKIEPMELDDYLKGVVAAEMPAAYNIEALKAQTVAARTYTLKKLPAYGGQGSVEHDGADICTDYRHSQAWLAEKDMKKKWGFLSFFYYWAKITRAVEETSGQVLVYENNLIDAVYHSNSGGQTEFAANVWGRKTPYLKSVESPYDKENNKNYQHRYKFKIQDFDQKLGTNMQLLLRKRKEMNGDRELLISESNNKIFRNIKYSESGRVLKIKIGDNEFEGKEIRKKLDLPSTMFEFSLQQNYVICDVLGNGHGVGLSQDGADGYANHDYNYRDILKHYYQGVEIVNISNFKK